MKRLAVIKQLKTAAKKAGKEFNTTVKKFFDQYANELGKGRWRE